VAVLEGADETLEGNAGVEVQDPSKLKRSYTARLIPAPASGYPPSEKLVKVGEHHLLGQAWKLDPGAKVNLEVKDAGGALIPSVVRVFRKGGFNTMPWDINLSNGTAAPYIAGDFHALVLPTGAAVPAFLELNKSAATLSDTWSISLDGGIQVEGKVTVNNGAGGETPLQGSTVTLYNDYIDDPQRPETSRIRVPSTTATTAADGSFVIHARDAAKVSLSVVPPPDLGLPVAEIEDLSIALKDHPTGWAFSFAQPQPVNVGGVVTRCTSATAAKSAQVVLTTTLGGQGATLTATAGSTVAGGRYRRLFVTNDSGVMVDSKTGATQVVVPPGSYQVEVWPGAQEAEKEGYSVTTTDLGGGGTAQLKLTLASRVLLQGKVEDDAGGPVAARVMASAEMGSFSADSDAGGIFTLHLNKDTPYSLVIRSTNKNVTTYVNPAFQIGGQASMTFKLPPALRIAGQLTLPTNATISQGIRVRIWCSGSDCPSNEIVDEAEVPANGYFLLRVPKTLQE
jgi:hypothetical protein